MRKDALIPKSHICLVGIGVGAPSGVSATAGLAFASPQPPRPASLAPDNHPAIRLVTLIGNVPTAQENRVVATVGDEVSPTGRGSDGSEGENQWAQAG